MAQAPKGGITIAGVFYKGGQFLPSNNEPKHGKFNRSATKIGKVHKVEIEPYVWVEARDGYRPLYGAIGGVFATLVDGKMVFCASEQTLKYFNTSRATAQELINKYNSGERWLAGMK